MEKILLLLAQPNFHKPWGLPAILFVIFGISLSIGALFVGRLFIKKEKVYNTIILSCGLLFLCMEIYHEVERYLSFGSYDWSSFPFQFCTMGMYMCLIIPFLKNNSFKKTLVMFLGIYVFLSGVLPLFFGQSNMTRWPNNFGVIFSFVWHILLLFVSSLSIGFYGLGRDLKHEYKYIILAFVLFIGITCFAQVLNVTIHFTAGAWPKPLEGFKEVGYIPNYELDPDSASLCYISPYFVSNLPVVFNAVWKKAGWFVCWMLYLVVFAFGSIVVYFSIYGFRRLDRIIRHRKDTEAISRFKENLDF